MNNIVLLATSSLHPNEYNPNEMTKAEFAELCAEVKHLGRVPKPIIVRPNGTGYVIVDGEHGWRAATENGIAEIPCEIVQIDDFEAMRQTYKRNQHGSHDPVKLGRMFEAMMRDRDLSARALAKEVDVSEGTIRNALAYAEADRLRNSYAWADATVRQVRCYLSMPAPIRDIWLDAGADPKTAFRALRDVRHYNADGKAVIRNFDHDGEDIWRVLVDADLVTTMMPADGMRWTDSGFVAAAHRAIGLWMKQCEFKRHIPDVAPYVQATARAKAPIWVLDRLPVSKLNGVNVAILSVDTWEQILVTCVERAGGSEDELRGLLSAAINLALREMGEDYDYADPRIVSLLHELDDAPDFIRDSEIDLIDKVRLHHATAEDLTPEAIDEAKREAIGWLRARDGWLRNGDLIHQLTEIPRDSVEETKARMRSISVESAFGKEVEKLRFSGAIDKREALFSNPVALVDRAVTAAKKAHAIREELIGERKAYEVLAERLAALPLPELKLLAALLIGEEMHAASAAPSFWLKAVREAAE